MEMKDVMTAILPMGMGAPRLVVLRLALIAILLLQMFALLFVETLRSMETLRRLKFVMTETRTMETDVTRSVQESKMVGLVLLQQEDSQFVLPFVVLQILM